MPTLHSNRRWLSWLLLAVSVAGCGDRPEREVPVGRLHLMLKDAQRSHWSGIGARPISVTMWYPAADGTQESEWADGVFIFGRSASQAVWRYERAHPMILLSHGTGGSSAQLSWLAESLAQAGFVALAVSHHGNTAAEERTYPHGFVLPWERAEDLRIALAAVLSNPEIGPRIDATRIGAAGFSLGGYTTLLLGGARHSHKEFETFCANRPHSPSCTLPPEADFNAAELTWLATADPLFAASLERAEADYREPRVRALLLMAPALVPALTEDSLRALSMPLALAVGSADSQTPPAENLKRLQALLPQIDARRIDGATHYVFLAPCTRRGRQFAGPICSDGEGINREQLHATEAAGAILFFSSALSADPTHAERDFTPREAEIVERLQP